MSVSVNCPYCLTPTDIPDTAADQPFCCGNCQKTVRPKKSGVRPAAPKSNGPRDHGGPVPSQRKTPPSTPAVKVSPPAPVKTLEAADKVPLLDVAEVVPAALQKDARSATANPFRELARESPAERPALEPAKPRNTRTLLLFGCIALIACLVTGGVAVTGTALYFLRPSWVALASGPHAETDSNNGPTVEGVPGVAVTKPPEVPKATKEGGEKQSALKDVASATAKTNTTAEAGRPAPKPIPAALTRPPSLAGEKTDVPLGALVDDVAVGGSGRFILLSLPTEQKLAVFDANERKVVKSLPLAEAGAKFAAGRDKLFVLLPAQAMLERYDLLTLEKETSVPLPFKGTPIELCMGHAATQPLLVCMKESEAPNKSNIKFLDATTLKPVELDWPDKEHTFNGPGVRASADGSVFAAPQGPKGIASLVLIGRTAKVFTTDVAAPTFVPRVDGHVIFTPQEVFTPELVSIFQPENPSFTNNLPLVPARQANFFIRLQDHNFVKSRPEGAKGSGDIQFYFGGQPLPFVTWTDFEGVFGPALFAPKALTAEQRYLLLPDAKLLVTIPSSNDRLELYKFDAEDLLTRTGKDYLFITSSPATSTLKDGVFAYQLAVRSRKGEVKYKVDAGPKGMTVSTDGKVTWNVPADYNMLETQATVAVSDASGQQRKHTFKIFLPIDVARKPGKTMAAAAGFEIKQVSLKADKEERMLTSPTSDVCLGGGGRFVLLALPKDQKVAVFDVNDASIVKHLGIGEDSFKIAANVDKLFVLLPGKGKLQRWSLRSLELEHEVPLPFKGTALDLCTGHAGRGPLVVEVKDEAGKGNLRYVDPETLQAVNVNWSDKTHIFQGKHVRASADGRVFAAMPDAGHVSCMVFGNKGPQLYTGQINSSLALPGPDGRTVYTANEAFNTELRDSLKLAVPGLQPITQPFLPAQQGGLFMRLEEHAAKTPRPAAAAREGGDILFYLPGQPTPFGAFRDFEGIFGQKLLAGAKSLSYDQRYILLPAAGVLISIPAANDRLVLHRFDLDELLVRFNKDYLFVSSAPVTTATRGSTYSYPVLVKSKQQGVVYELTKKPEGMKVTPEGKLQWDVPANFAGDEAEVTLKIADKSKIPAIEHSFRIAIEK